MSYDVFFQGFSHGGPGRGGGPRMRGVVAPFIASEDTENDFIGIRCEEGAAGLYLRADSMMATQVTGDSAWDLLVKGAQAAGWVILLPEGPTCLTSADQGRHLPAELARRTAIVASGTDLLRLIHGS